MTQPTPESSTLSYQFPSVVDLAKIAASFHPEIGADAEASVEEAVRLHLYAWIAHQKFAGLGPADIIAELNAPQLDDWVMRVLDQNDRLRLYLDNAKIDPETRKAHFAGDLDPARNYLNRKQSYGGWGKTRTVLNNIRMYFLDGADRHNRNHASTIEMMEKLHKKLAAAAGVALPHFRNGMEIPPENRRRDGEQEYTAFLSACAVGIPVSVADIQVAEYPPVPKIAYWNIPMRFLNKLMKWRLEVKVSGGVKKLEKRLLAASVPVKARRL